MKPHNALDVKQLFNNESRQLRAFFISVIVYFVFVRDPHGELWTTLLKCAPIVCLILHILLNGFGSKTECRYSRLIVLGLIFSCGGDILLNINLFPHGMGLFACAQICYIRAFGCSSFNWSIAVPLYMAGAAFVLMIFSVLDEILAAGLPIYVTLLLTMCSCAVSDAVDNKSFLNSFRAIGSVFFVMSDGLIGVDMFLMRVPNARIWIMSTYYLAQLAIAASVANGNTEKNSSRHLEQHSSTARQQTKSKD